MNDISGLLNSLRKNCNQFNATSSKTKSDLLDTLKTVNNFNSVALTHYHDCLLFLKAYPENKKLLKAANDELNRIAGLTMKIAKGKNAKQQMQLYGSGIENSYIVVQFSYDICKWLSENFSDRVQFFSCDVDSEMQLSVMKQLLPPIMYNDLEHDFKSIEKWFKRSKLVSEITLLEWILKLFENSVPDISMRDHLFDSLKIFVQVNIESPVISRTFNSGLSKKVFYHKRELIRHVDAKKIINKTIGKPQLISETEKEKLVASSRFSLMMLLRETDPVTYANVSETEWHHLDRGIDIALYYMKPERRNALDSYVGYMAYKNNCPIAYGGGWMFAQHGRIGINVFTPYRGGESAFIFCQIMRLYAQRFGVKQFEAEPYQIGHNNKEGIESGAFWFYYRLGYRPQQKELYELSEAEWLKISADRNYRCKTVVLKKLARSFMILKTGSQNFIPDANVLSKRAGQWVDENFKGDYKSAFDYTRKYSMKFFSGKALNKLSPHRKQVLLNFMIAIIAVDVQLKWNNKDIDDFWKLFLDKASGSEFDYIVGLNAHSKLLNVFSEPMK